MTMGYIDRQNRTLKAISAYAMVSATSCKEDRAPEIFGASISNGKKPPASGTGRVDISFNDNRQKAA